MNVLKKCLIKNGKLFLKIKSINQLVITINQLFIEYKYYISINNKFLIYQLFFISSFLLTFCLLFFIFLFICFYCLWAHSQLVIFIVRCSTQINFTSQYLSFFDFLCKFGTFLKNFINLTLQFLFPFSFQHYQILTEVFTIP